MAKEDESSDKDGVLETNLDEAQEQGKQEQGEKDALTAGEEEDKGVRKRFSDGFSKLLK